MTEKRKIEIDMTVMARLITDMEKELTDVLEKYYSKSPYEKWEMGFNIRSWGYNIEVALMPNPHLTTSYKGSSPINS